MAADTTGRPWNLNAPAPRIGGISLEQRQQRASSAMVDAAGVALGTVATPQDLVSFPALLDRMTRGDTNVGRITLGEGVYLVRDRVLLPRGTELYGTPGQTVIRYERDVRSVLVADGPEVVLSGIRFEVESSTSEAIAFVTGADYGTVVGCTFASCVGGAVYSQAEFLRVSDCLFLDVGAGTAVHLDTGSNGAVIQCNRFTSNASAYDVYAEDTVSNSAFTGNVLSSPGGLSYKGGTGCVGSGLNAGVVTVR